MIALKNIKGQMTNEQGAESEVARSSDSKAHRGQHRQGAAGHPFSFSFFLSERSHPPMLSPQILLSLSTAVALHRLVKASLVIVAPQTAIIRAEQWLRGKARGGSTVNLHKITTGGGRLKDCLLACSLSLSESAS